MSAYLPSPSVFLSALNSFERPEGSSNSTDPSHKFLPYNYVPTEWVCITFLALFGLSTCKAPPTLSTDLESLTLVVIRLSTPYCTSNTLASLVVIPHCSPLRRSRVLRLERSTVVESEPFHKEAIYHTVSKMQWFAFVTLLMGGHRAVSLVVAPTPLVAANFTLLGRVIRRLGPQYSRLTTTQCKSHKLSQSTYAAMMNVKCR
jgi:hypothetical protein